MKVIKLIEKLRSKVYTADEYSESSGIPIRTVERAVQKSKITKKPTTIIKYKKTILAHKLDSDLFIEEL